jgi:hypothetical protein
MAYAGNNNEVIDGTPVVLAPAAIRTASGSGPTLPTGTSHTLRLDLNITAASGTGPTLAVTVEHSADRTTWRAHSSFATASAAGSERRVISGLDRYVRCAWTLGGTTPSFDFSVTGDLV